MVRVFLSSVLGGLEDERRQLGETLRAAGFDAWLSEEQRPRLGLKSPFRGNWSRRVCLEAVRESDVYVGVFSTRYGGSERQHHAHVALTELEFYEAFRRGLPVLLYVLDASRREPWLVDSLVLLRGKDGRLDRDTIKAYALLRLRRTDDALGAFEAVLQARRDLGAGPDAIAESSGDVGWALFHVGRITEGTSLLKGAADRLERSSNPDTAGFLIRAKLKLSRAYLERSRYRDAAMQLAEARALCSTFGAWDQWSKVNPLGRFLVALLGKRLRARHDATGFKYETQ